MSHPRTQEGGIILGRDTLWRIAALGGGALTIIVSVLVGHSYWTSTSFIAGALAVLYGIRGQNVVPLAPLVHLLAVVPMLLLVFDLCGSQCGGMTYYETVGGVPTVFVAVIGHLTAAIMLCVRAVPVWLSRGCSVCCVGGSLFFASVLVGHGSWCGACMGTHAFSLALGLGWLTHGERSARGLVGIGVVAAAGILNAWYHHRPLPPVQNDPHALHVYMRDLWTRHRAPAVIVQSDSPDENGEGDEARVVGQHADGDVVQLGSLLRTPGSGAIMPGPDVAEQDGSAPAAASPPPADAQGQQPAGALGEQRPVGVLGSAQAPVILRANLDFACPSCRRFYWELKGLEDLIRDGQLEVQFYFSSVEGSASDRKVALAMANMAYAASAHSQVMMLRVIDALWGASFRTFQTPRDAVAKVDPIVPARVMATWIERSGEAITHNFQQTESLRIIRGVSATPTIWLHSRTSNQPLRTFEGFTSDKVLRLAIQSVADTVAQEGRSGP